MKRYLLFITTLFLLLPVFSFNDNDWNEMANFGGGERERAVAFSIGLKGYVATGQDSADNVHNDLWEYEPASNTWTQKATMPGVGRRNAVGFAVNGKGYVGTGINSPYGVGSGGTPLSDFYEYNPLTNSWSQKASYPGNFGQGVYFATGYAIGSKGYIVCGKESPSNYSTQHYEYNPATNSWQQRQSFPGDDRYALTNFVIGTKAYVGTGTDEDLMRKDFYAYNQTSNSWSQIADMPTPGRSACSGFAIGNQGFIVFGTDGGMKKELWEYHLGFDMWFQRKDYESDARKGGFAFSVGGKGYAGGGKANVNGVRSDFYEYIPSWPVGVEKFDEVVGLNVHPNPAVEHVNFSFEELANYTIFIYDVNGRLVKQKTLGGKIKSTMSLIGLINGLYIYKIQVNKSKHFITGKLLVKNK